MENYKILELIGEGSFGRVFRGMCVKKEAIVALKFIPKRNKVDRELRSLRRECEIQKELFHPNIVRMMDSFETEHEVVAVSEYVPIQLFAILKNHGSLTEERVQKIACNIVSAIFYLHSLRILHRDIKPQNILLTTDGEAKLCDFGFSRKMSLNTYVLTSIKGTPLYMAPELIEANPYDHTVDLWSLGCILFELLTGQPPFNTHSLVALVKMVREKPIKWPINLSQDCLSFLVGLLQKEPSQRLSWPEILQHPWVRDGIVIMAESIDVVPLTSPLSSSQQLIKEEQKQYLIHQTLSQPKILKNLTKRCLIMPRNISHCADGTPCEALIKEEPNTLDVNSKSDYCFKNEAFKLDTPDHSSAKTDEELKKTTSTYLSQAGKINSITEYDQDATEAHCLNYESMNTKFSDLLNVSGDGDVDARMAVGSSIRKLSTFSQESGFKDEDIADFRTVGPLPSEARKDSMVNYLSNSIDSSRRGSRPSFLVIENAGHSNLTNINEESIVDSIPTAICNANDVSSIGSDKPLEAEEWSRFLDKTLMEVLNGNFDIYMQQSELSLFISPLQKPSCPLFLTEKIISILMMPTVLVENKENLNNIMEIFLKCKVIANLIYAIKCIIKDAASSPPPKIKFSKEQMSVLKMLMALICNLVYNSRTFITQFCEAIFVWSSHEVLGKLIDKDIDVNIIGKLLAIMNQLMRINFDQADSAAETVSVVEKILTSTSTALPTLFSLMSHTSVQIRRSMCSFVGYSCLLACSYLPLLLADEKLLTHIYNLESDPNNDMQKAASFAVSSLQTCK